MDDIDRQILRLLEKDARMTVKEISARVSLTSPAVSERIRRMEKGGVIAGYTVVPGKALTKAHVDALISITVPQSDRSAFLTLVQTLASVTRTTASPASQICGNGLSTSSSFPLPK